jgi:broad specificity phosphatase PhoE
MRHGKPKIENSFRLNAEEFGVWVREYNTSGIDIECQPPQLAIEQADQCDIAVCSNLPRSLESAKALGIERVGICDPMFREMEMPYSGWDFPRLSVAVWSVFFRLVWALGFSENAESFKSARKRAQLCAEQLNDLASIHGIVLFIGHGSLNWFIAKYLKRMGWLCSENSPGNYWEYRVYSHPATQRPV